MADQHPATYPEHRDGRPTPYTRDTVTVRSSVSPGSLGRATMHDDPAVVAGELRRWFGRDDEGLAAAAAWLAHLIEALARG